MQHCHRHTSVYKVSPERVGVVSVGDVGGWGSGRVKTVGQNELISRVKKFMF